MKLEDMKVDGKRVSDEGLEGVIAARGCGLTPLGVLRLALDLQELRAKANKE